MLLQLRHRSFDILGAMYIFERNNFFLKNVKLNTVNHLNMAWTLDSAITILPWIAWSKAPFTPTGDVWRCTGNVFTTANSSKIASASPVHRQMICLTTYWRPIDDPVATHKRTSDDVLTTRSRPLTTSWRCTDDHWQHHDDHWRLLGELVTTHWQHCDVLKTLWRLQNGRPQIHGKTWL